MQSGTYALGFLAALSLAHAAAAATPQFLSSHQDWNLQVYDDASGKICYISSEPTEEDGNYTRRDAAAVLVAKLPMEAPNEQVSVQPGYGFKQGSSVAVDVDGEKFELFTRGEHAWAETPDDDEALIEAMKRGSRMTVRGTSTLDTFSLDTYSLIGFTAAYGAMLDACSNR